MKYCVATSCHCGPLPRIVVTPTPLTPSKGCFSRRLLGLWNGSPSSNLLYFSSYDHFTIVKFLPLTLYGEDELFKQTKEQAPSQPLEYVSPLLVQNHSPRGILSRNNELFTTLAAWFSSQTVQGGFRAILRPLSTESDFVSEVE